MNKIKEAFEKWHCVDKWVSYDKEIGIYTYVGIDKSKIRVVQLINAAFLGYQMGVNCIDEENKKLHKIINGLYLGISKMEPENNSADLLPTEKTCPECGGSGFDNNEDFTDDISKCSNCKNGIIQIYYTPEEYKTITGKDYPESACVWRKEVLKDSKGEYTIYHLMTYKNYKPYASPKILEKWLKTHQPYIVQTAQEAPDADYEKVD